MKISVTTRMQSKA